MKKNELISELAARSELGKGKCEELLNILQDIVYDHIADDDGGIKLFTGITLSRTQVKERNCRNPHTGETIIVPGHYKPVAKFGKLAKDTVNK